MTKSPLVRFQEKYQIDSQTGCWNWTGGINNGGYGSFHYQGKNRRSHRVSLILSGIEIPDEMVVCHRCDNPKCVNPEHLFVGTLQDNMRDAFMKKRVIPPVKFEKGMKAINRKLTNSQVKSIRRLNAAGMSIWDIAKKLSLPYGRVHGVLKLNYYSDIPLPGGQDGR